ncbi:hypothetical protein [Streptomyces goshikiensis]|uniref:hypothetical protein n=1 Tax=Streptomyces goshikiensis TaxID=1942 RepID=UPI003D9DBD60
MTEDRPKVVVHPPDAQGGRRVRADGEILGRALNPRDLVEFLRRPAWTQTASASTTRS